MKNKQLSESTKTMETPMEKIELLSLTLFLTEVGPYRQQEHPSLFERSQETNKQTNIIGV